MSQGIMPSVFTLNSQGAQPVKQIQATPAPVNQTVIGTVTADDIGQRYAAA
jgi:hypothetical protein